MHILCILRRRRVVPIIGGRNAVTGSHQLIPANIGWLVNFPRHTQNTARVPATTLNPNPPSVHTLEPVADGARMPDLDGLRAMAILLVLLCHFVSPCFPWAIVRRATAFGWCGVDLFFVLSGFLIGGILLDHRKASNYFSVFYLRRFYRIMPLYWLILLPLILIVALGLQTRFPGHGLEGQTWGTLLVYLTFQQNLLQAISRVPGYLAPAWSLAIEEQFYLLLPPLIRHLPRETVVKWLVAAIILAPLARAACCFWANSAGNGVAIASLVLPCRWDALLPGVLIAIALRDARFCRWIVPRLGAVRAVWLVLAAGVVGLATYDSHLADRWNCIGGYTWIALFFAATLLLSRVNAPGRLRTLLSRPIWKPLATISYGLYLIQGPVMALRESVVNALGCSDFGWRKTGVYALFLALTFFLALVSWYFFEKPILEQYKKSYSRTV